MSKHKGMNPIKDKIDIQRVLNKLKDSSYRNYMIGKIGFNTGLRCGDLRRLKVSDVKDADILVVRTEKGDTLVQIPIHKQLQKDIKDYIEAESLSTGDYLFTSRQIDANGMRTGISTTQMYRIMREVFRDLQIEGCGTHTFRKTYAYHYYRDTKCIESLRRNLGHDDIGSTIDYVRITEEEILDSYEGFKL